MATNNISKVGEFISNNKKPLLYIGGAIAIVVVGYAIVTRIKGGIGGILTNKTIGASEFKAIEVDQTKSTISDTLANTYANQLFNAMKDAGTNTDLIYTVLEKLQKKDDFRKVYNAFGKRSYLGFGETGWAGYLTGDAQLDLVEWFDAEVGYSNPMTYNLIKKTVNNAGFAF
jgi:hypothetical protein